MFLSRSPIFNPGEDALDAALPGLLEIGELDDLGAGVDDIALDGGAQGLSLIHIYCDDEAQATEELYHLGWVLEFAGGRDDATWVCLLYTSRCV